MRHCLFLLVAIAASFIAVGNVKADPLLLYTLTGTLTAQGGDSTGLNGATMTVRGLYDNLNGVYIDRFGFSAIPALAADVEIVGAPNGANDGKWDFTQAVAFYPQFAGTFTEPDGLFTELVINGNLMQWGGNTDPSVGSANAGIGSAVELDDFAPANYTGFGLVNLSTGEGYTFDNVRIDALKVPEPASASLLAIGLVGVLLRRRRVA